jgi:3-dehydroquinate dehydratase-2
MTARVLVLNGPNLGELGRREPEVYGRETYDELVTACTTTAAELGLEADVRQTDDEATYLEWLHEAAHGGVDALVLNPAAWTHTSVAIRDAASMLPVPYVEVHLSNPVSREAFRHTSFTAGKALGLVAGFGLDSYRLALRALASQLGSR